MAEELTLGFSPCPNDTFIFYALVHKRVFLPGLDFKVIIRDVEELNQLALRGEVDITKISYHTLGYVLDEYCLLRSGGALGRGCGPLLVTREGKTLRDIKGKPVAVPGRYTTAYLLLCLYDREIAGNALFMSFDRIMDEVKKERVAAGVIIHESRFTYRSFNLTMLVDLGKWWEEETALPIPLGGIVAKRSLGNKRLKAIESLIRESISYAYSNPEETRDYIRSLAQEMDPQVITSHINLYVNPYSLDIGPEGQRAVEEMMRRASNIGLIPKNTRKIMC
ncbi:MAG: 1,4-dihydroxy-6-naphthoate synthase [Nitrospirae bacterium]|nr:MAG: 1,4-dihydroxy-6-naphthoate synthase [Nitrospirota bacterium]